MSSSTTSRRQSRAPGSWLLPDDIQPPELDDITAAAELVLEAVLYPCTLPAEPYPAPIDVALSIIASRLYIAGKAGEGQSVVSESLGSYTYRLAEPMSAEAAALVPPAVLELVRPWTCRDSVYDLSTFPSSAPLPFDYWQRDLDNELAKQDALELEAASS